MKHFRVAEIFGPTIQGEGRHIGIPCYFIRFGGCDYRCVWCDSPHAVLPHLVARLNNKTEIEIVRELQELPGKARWVVLSGGNPALFDLTRLIAYLNGQGYSVMIETQGTIWKEWIGYLDEVCVSPKPPSSRNATEEQVLTPFLEHFEGCDRAYLKVVVFDDIDYEYARWVHATYPHLEMFVSSGNEDKYLPTVGNPDPGLRDARVDPRSTQEVVLKKMRWLMEKVSIDREMRDVRVLPQMHVLAWGNQRGR